VAADLVTVEEGWLPNLTTEASLVDVTDFLVGTGEVTVSRVMKGRSVDWVTWPLESRVRIRIGVEWRWKE